VGHKITISGDALTVSVPDIHPSTTTIGTNSVSVILKGAVSDHWEPAGTCAVVTAGIRVSGPAAGPSGEARHRIEINRIHRLYKQ
jgi:hypothetical protein